MKVEHICVGNSVNSVHNIAVVLTPVTLTVILILQHLLDFGCRIPPIDSDAIFRIQQKHDRKIAKSSKFFHRMKWRISQKTLPEMSVVHSGESFRNTFYNTHVSVILP